MISSYFQGGLGNQMFQIAAATSLAVDNGDSAVFNMGLHDLPKQGRRCHNYLNSILRNFIESRTITTRLSLILRISVSLGTFNQKNIFFTMRR